MNLVGANPVKKPSVRPVKPVVVERIDKAPNVPKVLESHEIPQPPSQPAPQAATQVTPDQQTDAVQEKPPVAEENVPKITAIVCELINQELGSVADRFHLNLTDSNLWELTKAALEDVRPEFSADSMETEKKLERLRPQVIAAMAKAAIKLSAKGRNS